MSLVRRIVTHLRRSANLFRFSRVDREIDAELKAHIEMRIEDNLAAGMSPEEARRDAQLRFGNTTVMRERTTAAGHLTAAGGIGRDVHYALKTTAPRTRLRAYRDPDARARHWGERGCARRAERAHPAPARSAARRSHV